ncbi:yciQ [Escherichia coli O25b:H4]|uniref:YciQ n=1 Tax=Escherichia coli O25b:H4 TaxID=941280 RepID=A0A192CLS2_ECO25|nr:yciQ [Escherichia coli O25b:H4]
MIETDVIPPDYTPGMLRLDAKLVYDDKGFLRRYRKSDCERKNSSGSSL